MEWVNERSSLLSPQIESNARWTDGTRLACRSVFTGAGRLGLCAAARRAPELKRAGDLLVLIGREQGHLGQSLYQLIETGKNEGAPPPVDLTEELKAGNLVRALIREGKVTAVHDVSDGGLLVAVAEMALAGSIGVEVYPYEGKLPAHAIWFGEDQGRYVLAAHPSTAEEVADRARLLGLPARIVGRAGGNALSLKGEAPLPLADLKAAHEAWLPTFMGG